MTFAIVDSQQLFNYRVKVYGAVLCSLAALLGQFVSSELRVGPLKALGSGQH